MFTAPRRPDLANEPVGRLMLRLSIPTITAQLVNMLYNLVDRIYISYIPDVGTLALTGLGVCLPIILLVSAFAALCASSGAPLASIAMGQRNNEKAEGILGSCTALLLCVSAVLTVVLSCFYTPILLAFGATEDALPYAQRYIAIYSLGTVFVQLSLGLNPFITAQGFSKAGMLTVLIGAVLNTLLDPLFIFVFHMGMAGAALATITGQILSFALVVFYLRGFKTLPLSLSDLKPKIACWARIAALGATPAFNQVAMMVVQIVMNNTLTYYGSNSVYGSDIPLACAGIISKVNMLFFSFVIGISQGLQPIVSFNFGAQKYDRVKDAYKKAVFAATAISIVAFLCFQLFPRQIIGIFGSGSEEYLHFAERYFRIFLFFTFLNGIQPVSSNFFTSIGAPKKGIFLSLTRQIIFLLPLLLIFPYLFGIDGVMYTAPIADLAAASVSIVMVVREFKIMAELQKTTA